MIKEIGSLSCKYFVRAGYAKGHHIVAIEYKTRLISEKRVELKKSRWTEIMIYT